MIRAIAAIDDKRGIASKTSAAYSIPWDIPIDFDYFKSQTETGPMIMGRGVYDTLISPLVGRRNLVMSNTLTQLRSGFELLKDYHSFLTAASGDVWIIGGEDIYTVLLDYCDELYLTHVEGDYDCDRFFPKYESAFQCTWTGPQQTQNGYNFKFSVYVATKNRRSLDRRFNS